MSVKTLKRQLAVEYSSHWLETAAVATFPVVEITDCVHSFQRVPGRIVRNALSVMTVCQYETSYIPVHRTVSLSWVIVLGCIPCTSPAAVEHSYY